MPAAPHRPAASSRNPAAYHAPSPWRRLFSSVGCLACHTQKDEGGRVKDETGRSSFIRPPSSFPLTGLGAKTTPARFTPRSVAAMTALDVSTPHHRDSQLPAPVMRLQVLARRGRIVPAAAIWPDPKQTWLLNADGENDEIRVLNREDGTVVGSFGRNGRNAGEFHFIHNLAVDSKGNTYTTEVDTGKRAQKFRYVGPPLK